MGVLVAVLIVVLVMATQGIGNLNVQSIQSNSIFLVTLALVGFAASYFFFYLCTHFVHHRSFISLFTTKSRINWNRMLKGAVLWFLILGMLTLIFFLINPTSYKITFNLSTFGLLLILSLITFPIQASFEEVFFRGYLMQGVGLLSKKPIIPLLATSFLFGIGHVMNGTGMTFSVFPLIETVIIGIALGTITLGEDGIETAIGIHVMNNLYAVLIVSTPGSVFGDIPSIITTTSSPLGDITMTAAAAIIAIIIIFWNKKDKLAHIFRWEDAKLN
ncbi:lysostaphin resistance A-like protein [Methanobacterium sp.]|uniref:CPBP family intramembrane glutamic endopeptidase n=1 Tax=Methanobacterium sp. TaxID=2164 RepID=UPI003C72ADBE